MSAANQATAAVDEKMLRISRDDYVMAKQVLRTGTLNEEQRAAFVDVIATYSKFYGTGEESESDDSETESDAASETDGSGEEDGEESEHEDSDDDVEEVEETPRTVSVFEESPKKRSQHVIRVLKRVRTGDADETPVRKFACLQVKADHLRRQLF